MHKFASRNVAPQLSTSVINYNYKVASMKQIALPKSPFGKCSYLVVKMSCYTHSEYR